MHINHPLNKNWFHITNGYYLKTKHVVGGLIGLIFLIAINIGF